MGFTTTLCRTPDAPRHRIWPSQHLYGGWSTVITLQTRTLRLRRMKQRPQGHTAGERRARDPIQGGGAGKRRLNTCALQSPVIAPCVDWFATLSQVSAPSSGSEVWLYTLESRKLRYEAIKWHVWDYAVLTGGDRVWVFQAQSPCDSRHYGILAFRPQWLESTQLSVFQYISIFFATVHLQSTSFLYFRLLPTVV